MPRTRWIAVAVVAAVCVSGCSSKKDKEMIAQKDAELAKLQQQIQQLEGDLQSEKDKSAKLNSELNDALADYQSKEQVWLQQKESQSVVTVSDEVMFASGGTDMTDTGKAIVDRIAEVAAGYPTRNILVEGHTDDVPIGPALKEYYYSNWELSTARAASVLRYLYWKHKIDPSRLSAVGYGEYRPIADNTTENGRAMNRRVVIVIGPESRPLTQ